MTRLHAEALVLGLALLIFSAGCMQAPQGATAANLSPGQYVFVEQRFVTNGETLEGGYPRLMIDFPTYFYDAANGTLDGMITFPVNGSMCAVYGDFHTLTGDAGGGASSRLDGVYAFPYTSGALSIVGIDAAGTAEIVADNQTITLESGEAWTNTTTRIVSEPGWYTIRMTENRTILNHGILEKSRITVR